MRQLEWCASGRCFGRYFKSTLFALFLAGVTGGFSSCSTGDGFPNNNGSAIPESETEKVFFSFDDHSIPWKDNLQLTMVKPQKYAVNPVVTRGGKGTADEWAVQFYGSVIKHEGKFKMWYIAADNESLARVLKEDKNYSGLRPAYAESTDGIHWHKPDLGLVEYRGNKNNNLVLMDPPDAAGIHLIVLYEPDDPSPDKQFKMLLTVAAKMPGRDLKTETSIVLYSADGLRWKSATDVKFERGVLSANSWVLPPVYFEQGGLYRWKGSYHLAGQQFEWWIKDSNSVGRVMTVFRSPDLLNWDSAKSYSFRRDDIGDPSLPPGQREEAHLASSVWHRNNVLLGVFGLWHGAEKWEDRSMDLGFLLSNDGIHFREPIRDYTIIDRGEAGKWDEGGLLQGQGFANIGDKTYIWYGSWDMTKTHYPPRGGVGLVTLRRDGFGYLSPAKASKAAHFITRTIERHELSSDKISLRINAEGLSDTDPLKVELVDGRGVPLPGYSGSQAALVTTSGVLSQVEWPTGETAAFVDEDFAVKVSFPEKQAVRMYALYVDSRLK